MTFCNASWLTVWMRPLARAPTETNAVRFPWPSPINGLFIAKDMTEPPPTIQRTITAHQAEPCAPRHFANSSEIVGILSA